MKTLLTNFLALPIDIFKPLALTIGSILYTWVVLWLGTILQINENVIQLLGGPDSIIVLILYCIIAFSTVVSIVAAAIYTCVKTFKELKSKEIK